MSKKTIVFTVLLTLLLSLVPIFLTILSGDTVGTRVLVLPLTMVLLSLSSLSYGNGKRSLSLLFTGCSALLTFIGAVAFSLLSHKAGLWNAVLYGIVSIIPYLPLIHIYINKDMKGGLLLLSSAILCGFIYLLLSRYLRSYIFLYELTGGYGSYSTLMRASVSFVYLAFLGGSFFKTQRNYITYCALLISSIIYGILETERVGGTVLSFFSSASLWTVLMVAISIWIDEKPEKRKWERRNIIFKDLVYEEVKPMKKRVRKQIFEIPPNVPKMKRNFTQDMKNEGIKNGKNDQ